MTSKELFVMFYVKRSARHRTEAVPIDQTVWSRSVARHCKVVNGTASAATTCFGQDFWFKVVGSCGSHSPASALSKLGLDRVGCPVVHQLYPTHSDPALMEIRAPDVHMVRVAHSITGSMLFEAGHP